jgi:hypothetical protein
MSIRKPVSSYVGYMWKNAASIRQIFLIYHNGEFYHNMSRKCQDMNKIKYIQKITFL